MVARFAVVRFVVLFAVVRLAVDLDFVDFAVERLAGGVALDGFAAARFAVERFAAGAFGSPLGLGLLGLGADRQPVPWRDLAEFQGLRLLGLVTVVGVGVDAELARHLPAEPVVREHALDGLLDRVGGRSARSRS